jgi:Toastrack DUF4097
MRSFIVMAMFSASLAHAGWTDYQEIRELDLSANGLARLTIDAGAGSMDVTGVAGLDKIMVVATIVVPDKDEDHAVRVIQKKMRLSLQRNGDDAELEARFKSGLMSVGASPYIALAVSVPQGMAVSIEDGSGSIDVIDVAGNVSINDGSGSIDIRNVAHLNIDDGSGSIDVVNVVGDVSIVDGSGSISVEHVQGSVTIDDGSGSINVSDVERDLIIVDDGSGSLRYSDIRGTVDADT